MRYRPSIPDNVRYWKVFEEDSEIQRFLQTVQEFSDLIIDGDNLIAEQEQENLEQKYHNRIAGHEIMQLPTNYIPKGLVPLERIFDQNDVPVKPPDKQNSEEVVDCNLGTSENPKFVKISKALSGRQRGKYEKLLHEFSDIFAWKYDDLRTFDKEIIQHRIPLKENVRPHQQKLRQINPLLMPIMEKEVKKLLDVKIIVPL